MAKEDALSQLHAERRLRLSAEDRCVEFSRKMAELEAQLRALQTAGQVCQIPRQITNYLLYLAKSQTLFYILPNHKLSFTFLFYLCARSLNLASF